MHTSERHDNVLPPRRRDPSWTGAGGVGVRGRGGRARGGVGRDREWRRRAYFGYQAARGRSRARSETHTGRYHGDVPAKVGLLTSRSCHLLVF